MIAMIATDSKPWIRLPLTDEGLQGLSHRRIHSVEPWKVTETMLNPTWATSATVSGPWSATNSGQPPTVSTQDLNLNIWEQH